MTSNVRVPLWKILAILIGFPIISFLISLLLLHKDWFEKLDIDFFTTFWILITIWYLIQIWITIRVLSSSKLGLEAIGYTFNIRKTAWFLAGYLVIALALVVFVEFALASTNISAEEINALSDLSDITPLTTKQRIIFIFAGMVAGISEEFVYRGFTIQSLEKHGVNKWIAVVIAAVPFVFQHGLKSIDQFGWFFVWGLVFGAIFMLTSRKLYITIVIHWVVILSAILAILQVVE